MNLMRYENLFNEFCNQMNQLLGRIELPKYSNEIKDFVTSSWLPEVDIEDKENSYIVKVNVPGVEPENLDIQFRNNILTIKGKAEAKHEKKEKNFLRLERSCGEFIRSFSLPDVDSDAKLEAHVKNGVLMIEMPKSKSGVSRKIEIKS